MSNAKCMQQGIGYLVGGDGTLEVATDKGQIRIDRGLDRGWEIEAR